MPPTPLVIQTEHLDADAAAWLAARARLVSCSPEEAGFASALLQAEGLVVRTYTRVDAALLAAAPRLRVVGRAGVGLDNIDVPACRARGVEVVYTPDANTQAVVEYVVAIVLDALRPRITLDRAVDASEWNRLREATVGVRQLSELTIGILGLGRVGRGVARAMTGIGCRVLYNDLAEIPDERRHGAEPVSVENLFTAADVLSIHIDGRPSNRRFVDAALLARLRDDALAVNTSRGHVIDTAALAEFMRSHPAARAAIDVHDPEPLDPASPLLGLPNVALYPHLASRTVTAMRNMSWVVRDVAAVLDGNTPRFPAPRA